MQPAKRTIFSICVIVICMILSACNASSAYQSAATYTALPTYTSNPTYTPFPTYTAIPHATPTFEYRLISWIGLNDFLAADHTNWHEYDFETYNCVNYAMELVSNARAAGINAWIVTVLFQDSDIGHAFVAFPTTDKGTVWIEPQSDYAYAEVQVGEPLCWKIEPTRCQDWGIVVEITQPAECDWHTHMCWEKED